MGKKKKKEKIVYYDDGSSVADMSKLDSKPKFEYKGTAPIKSLKAQSQTFFGAMKMMFVPMLVVICGLCILYMILYFLFFLLA
ncbi:MAG: hypothetical protein IJB65_06435 [Clostridia bacterium]|nr:hypothetical protein [Clostridia bacterium]